MTLHHNERNRPDTSTRPASPGDWCWCGKPAAADVCGYSYCAEHGAETLANALRHDLKEAPAASPDDYYDLLRFYQ